MPTTPAMNTLFYGDNLDILREYIADESVDLVYLDPPFNSNATYNVLFHAPTGEGSQAQIEAFGDTWHWNTHAEDAFDQVVKSGNSDAAEMLRAMRSFLKENDMMAYLAMMAVRLLELHRVLKPTGSLYLHCDPTASHYLKILLDAVFGKQQYRTEIVWQRNYAHNDAKQGRHQYGSVHDVIFFYTKSSKWTWNWLYSEYDDQYVESFYRHSEPGSSRRPLALLERIIAASSNEGDPVLDPFCGCGTTVHAAQKLNRRWIGIDITHLAISLIKRRLIDAYPLAKFEIHGVPKDFGAARELALADKHQFQLWALSMIEAQPYKGGKKGGDTGIDGYLYFKPDGKVTEKTVVSVKGGQNLNPNMVRDLVGTVDAEKAKMGVFLTLEDPTTGMRTAATKAGFYETEYGKYEKIQILTVEDLFDGKRPHMPWVDPSVFKKAKREKTEKQNELDL